jgi:ribosomal protein L22
LRRLLQARGSDLRVHFKNSREAAHSLRGMDLNKAKTYMQAVIDHKRCVPFLRYNGEQQQQQQRGAQAGSAGSLLLLSAAGAGSAEHSCKSVRQRRKRSSFGAVQQLQSRQRSY